jgi:transcriptional regulator with XRE-family HTH domain
MPAPERTRRGTAGKILDSREKISRLQSAPRDVGDHVQAWRTALTLPVETLAEEAGVTGRTVRNVEAGLTRKLETVQKLLDALHRLAIAPSLPPEGEPALPTWLELPEAAWNPEWSGPAALLSAWSEVVPFHGTAPEQEITHLFAWCRNPATAGLRVYKGAGGMGKTRLALELCRRLGRCSGKWLAGFLRPDRFPVAGVAWPAPGGSVEGLLVVVDYAGDEARTGLVARLLAALPQCRLPRVRLLLLDRDDLWLGRLLDEAAAARLMPGWRLGALHEPVSLRPVAVTRDERGGSWRLAAQAFAQRLGLPVPGQVPERLAGRSFDTVLLLHSQALLATFGGPASAREQDILRGLLHRERAYWRRRLPSAGLGRSLLPAVEAGVWWIGQNGGAADLAAAEQILGRIPLLRGQPALAVRQVTLLLKECYPDGRGGIAPLQPDRLREFLGTELLAGLPAGACDAPGSTTKPENDAD